MTDLHRHLGVGTHHVCDACTHTWQADTPTVICPDCRRGAHWITSHATADEADRYVPLCDSEPVDTDDLVGGLEGPAEARALLAMLTAAIGVAVGRSAPVLDYETRDELAEHGFLGAAS